MSNQSNSFGMSGGYTMNAPQVSHAEQAPAGNGDGELIKDTTTAGFTRDVIQESRNQTVLVDFWAPWCGPCKQLTPILEKAVRAASGAVRLVKMNIDEHPAIAGQLGIQSIPAVIAFRNGQPVDGFMGVVPESEIAAFIKKVGGDGAKEAIEDALGAAVEARAAGDADLAGRIYGEILQMAPDNVAAIAGAADLAFEAGDAESAQALLAGAPQAKADAPELAAVRARIALAEEVKTLGDPVALQKRLDADPKDHQARFDLAMIHNARGEREAAADNLLAIFKADRNWNDDGARQQLLKLFEAWGPMDEATLSARRKLSALLFS